MRSIRFVVLTALAVVLVALTSSAATARPDGAAATRVTVTFWHAYAENPAAPEMQQLTKSVIPRFEKLNPGIKVQQIPFSYGNLQQKLTTSAAGGTLPDLIRSDLAWVPQYAKLGRVRSAEQGDAGLQAVRERDVPRHARDELLQGQLLRPAARHEHPRADVQPPRPCPRPGSARRRRRSPSCAPLRRS